MPFLYSTRQKINFFISSFLHILLVFVYLPQAYSYAYFFHILFFKEHAQTTFFVWALHLENIPLSKICFEMINSAKT